MAGTQVSVIAEHAPELLQGAVWVIGVLGSLIVVLFGAGLAVIKWAIMRYENAQKTALAQINERLDKQDSSLNEIKEFMAKELYELREWFHRLDKDVIIIKERHSHGMFDDR
jgi:uncharacterized protein YpmB